MDNDKQITEIRPEVKLFLREDLFPEAPDVFDGYNFDREFEETKKNKNRLVIFLMIFAVVASIGITVGVSAYLSKKNSKITVSINSFQDLNLKKLLASFQRVQDDLDTAVAEKDQLRKIFQNAIQQTGFTRDSALVVLDSMLLGETERKERSDTIIADYEEKTQTLKKDYNIQVAEIDKKIAELQVQLSTLKTPELEQARANQGAIDSREQVFSLEKKKLVQVYEQQLDEQSKRFNDLQKQSFENQKKAVEEVSKQFREQISTLDPVFTDEKANNLVAEAVTKSVPHVNLTAASNPILIPTENENLKKIQNDIETVNYLSAFLMETTQKNSVPKYISAVKNTALSMGATVQNLVDTSIGVRETTQKELALLRSDQDKLLGGIKKELLDSQNQLDITRKNLADMTAKYTEANAKSIELTKSFNSSNTSVTTLTRQNANLTTQIESANAKTTDLTSKLLASSSQVTELQRNLTETATKLKTVEAEAAIRFQMENYLLKLVKEQEDTAFVVDIGDRKSFLIQVHPDQTARIENRTVYVFSRETNELLGSAIIRKKGSSFYAYPENVSLGQKVSSGDQISLTSTLKKF